MCGQTFVAEGKDVTARRYFVRYQPVWRDVTPQIHVYRSRLVDAKVVCKVTNETFWRDFRQPWDTICIQRWWLLSCGLCGSLVWLPGRCPEWFSKDETFLVLLSILISRRCLNYRQIKSSLDVESSVGARVVDFCLWGCVAKRKWISSSVT